MTQNSLVLFVCFVFLLEIHEFLEVLDLISHTNILNSGCSMTISSQFIFFPGSVSVHKHGNGRSYTAKFTLTGNKNS